MTVKNAFEPKEARITFDEKYYCYDSEDIKGRKRVTGTQALVEFLNTTSPEEFHKRPTKRSSALFFKRRNDKKSNTGNTIHRKSYIEIIANPFTFTRSKNNKTNQPLLSDTASTYDQPILPIHRKSTQTQTNYRRQTPSLRVSALNSFKENTNNSSDQLYTVFNAIHNTQDDLIEGGLKQRLEKYQLNQKPSDVISRRLAKEHLVALEVVSNMVEDGQPDIKKKKKKARHIQVQTMPFYPNQQDLLDSRDNNNNLNPEIESDQDQLKEKLAKVEKELELEKVLNSRLQASLNDTRDQFEVLSGLAYKKLREVWEEKTRWENACIETKEKCWHDHQQLILGKTSREDESDILSFTTMDILEDDDEDDDDDDSNDE
ncbi:hypothetical protein INT48_001352 [Thamnidium elegans]|uniref:Uncharacterized protein n=1 Tax=Thamnidium elegans TaxID=101142 RepID=A0A8H7W2M8_9FUNG|nr:hypothetical protein INT48_001352 [Thamnidium elegans]